MKTLSIVIPVYNESKRIGKILKALEKGFDLHGLKLEKIIFVDDGSSDSIKEKIQKANLKKSLKVPVEIIFYQSNRGRGYAVKKGALRCSSDYVLYADADLSIPLKNLKNFIPLMEKNYDLLFASKKKPGAKQTINRGWLRNIVGYGHSIIASLILGVFAWDFQGGFKLFSKRFVQEVFPLLTVERWGFDMEVIFLARKLGYPMSELAVVWGHIENGSKVKLLRDILRSLKEMRQIKRSWLKKEYTAIDPIPYISFTS